MAKTYIVSGQSTTRPTDLPDGFTVEVTEGPFEAKIGAYSDNDSHSLEIRDISSGSLKIAFTSSTYERKEPWLNVGKSQVAKLRDALTEWLDDGPKTDRVFLDEHADLWFEVTPGRFTYGDDRSEAIQESSAGVSDFANWTIERLRAEYEITDVTSEHPRP